MSWDKLIPDMSNFNNLVLAASIFLFYAGMEMSAVHVKDVNDPCLLYTSSSRYSLENRNGLISAAFPSILMMSP